MLSWLNFRIRKTNSYIDTISHSSSLLSRRMVDISLNAKRKSSNRPPVRKHLRAGSQRLECGHPLWAVEPNTKKPKKQQPHLQAKQSNNTDNQNTTTSSRVVFPELLLWVLLCWSFGFLGGCSRICYSSYQPKKSAVLCCEEPRALDFATRLRTSEHRDRGTICKI